MANFGFRAHDFGTFNSATDLAKEIEKILTPSYIQLALSKVFSNYENYSDLTIEEAITVKNDLDAHNIKTAIVGCYINPIHPDENVRKAQWNQFIKALEIAPYLGCPYVGTETGITKVDDEYDISTFSDKNLSIFYSFLDKMLSVAQKNNTVVAIEPVANKHTICSIERSVSMLNKFKCDNLKIIYDSVNLMDRSAIKEKDGAIKLAPSYEAQKAFHDYFLDELAKDIIAIHIKDFKIDNHGIKVGDLPIGTGVMNYKALFNSLNEHNVKAPRLLEMVNLSTLKNTVSNLLVLDT